MQYNKEKLAEDVMIYRAIHNLNQKEFAEKCNVSRETINLVEAKTANLRSVSYYKIMNVIEGSNNESKQS